MPKCDFDKVALQLSLCEKCPKYGPEKTPYLDTFHAAFIEIALRHGWFPVNLLHIFRTPFPRNTSGWLLLKI